MANAHEIYDTTIRSLPLSERLRLAAIILDDVTQSAASVLDFSESWSEEDVRDLAAFSFQHAAAAYPEDKDVV